MPCHMQDTLQGPVGNKIWKVLFSKLSCAERQVADTMRQMALFSSLLFAISKEEVFKQALATTQ